jgi:hypothetical protein
MELGWDKDRTIWQSRWQLKLPQQQQSQQLQPPLQQQLLQSR